MLSDEVRELDIELLAPFEADVPSLTDIEFELEVEFDCDAFPPTPKRLAFIPPLEPSVNEIPFPVPAL